MVISAWTSLAILILVIVGVSAIRCWAEHKRILDIPNPRSSHSVPTPRGGGLVIVLVTLAGLGFMLRSTDWSDGEILAFFSATTLIAVVSWIDDLHSLSNGVRLTVHFVAAAIVLFGSGRLLEFPGPTLPTIVISLTSLIWIAGLTNAYNFMDGIDGIAATQAVIAGVTWSILATESRTTATLALVLAIASLGFLWHNWPPAKIFMGDVGSAFLGFAFATIPLMPGGRPDTETALLVVWPFVFDTTFTFLRRLRNGESVFSAHRSHLYQRLVIAGMSHRSVTIIYGVLAAVGASLAIWIDGRDHQGERIAIPTIGVFAVGLWLTVIWKESRAQTMS